MLIALDASALVHAKALKASASGGLSGLELVHRTTTLGATFALSTGVNSELVGMSLSTTLERWKDDELITIHSVGGKAVRQFDSAVPKRVARPGRNDQALVCLAHQLDAVVLTHDTGLATYARATRLLTIDLVDIGALLTHT